MNDSTPLSRERLARRIHDLLLQETGESVDVHLMLGPPEYARAVLSLCRSSRNAELVRLGEVFMRRTSAPALERPRRERHVDPVREGHSPPPAASAAGPSAPTGFASLL